ncbi:MAG: motility associated factor glycosyltransferase family protein [Roseburia sp.]
MDIWERNLVALKKLGDGLVEKCQEVRKTEILHSSVEQAETQEKIICQRREDRVWRLNSIYNPGLASELYAQRYKNVPDFSVFCIFGFSDGRVITELLKEWNETQTIIIYEPDLETFLLAMEYFPLQEIFERKNLFLSVRGLNEDDLQKSLEAVVTYQNHLLMNQCILPNYDVLYTEECQKFMDYMIYYSKMKVFVKNTEIDFAKRIGDNILENIPYLLKESSIDDLKKSFEQYDLTDIPAVIVSAGPSLDKNIHELKEIGGRAFVIGVDSALKALIREEIPIHIAVSVDPRKNPDVFEDERINQLPFVVSMYSLPLIAKKNKNRLFFEGGVGFGAFENLIEQKTGKEISDLRTGGSVATDAFSLALMLGFKKIIMMGQDLAFTGGKGHVSGFEKSAEADAAHVENREKVEVEAYGGGRVLTDLQMDSYRQWFEMRIKERRDEITVYNATEGGARIEGTIEIPLHEILKKCEKELEFHKMVERAPKLFSEEKEEEIKTELCKIPEIFEEIKQHLEKGIQAYERMLELEKLKKQNTKEYKEALETVAEVNAFGKNNAWMKLSEMYAKSKEYEATEDIFLAEELSVGEIAERGKKLLEAYVEGIVLCQKQIEDILLPNI